MLERLGNVDGVQFVNDSLAQALGARATPRFEVALVYQRQVDATAERERLQKELSKLESQSASAERQLGNEQFLAKAPPKVVEGLKKQLNEIQILLDKNRRALETLK
jgi:valyl-tRNA synthetase